MINKYTKMLFLVFAATCLTNCAAKKITPEVSNSAEMSFQPQFVDLNHHPKRSTADEGDGLNYNPGAKKINASDAKLKRVNVSIYTNTLETLNDKLGGDTSNLCLKSMGTPSMYTGQVIVPSEVKPKPAYGQRDGSLFLSNFFTASESPDGSYSNLPVNLGKDGPDFNRGQDRGYASYDASNYPAGCTLVFSAKEENNKAAIKYKVYVNNYLHLTAEEQYIPRKYVEKPGYIPFFQRTKDTGEALQSQAPLVTLALSVFAPPMIAAEAGIMTMGVLFEEIDNWRNANYQQRVDKINAEFEEQLAQGKVETKNLMLRTRDQLAPLINDLAMLQCRQQALVVQASIGKCADANPNLNNLDYSISQLSGMFENLKKKYETFR